MPNRQLPVRRTALLLAAVALTASAAGCSGSSAPAATDGIITASASPAGPLTANFNPFSSTSPLNIVGGASMINEPLFITNPVNTTQVTPWLAKSWSFSPNGMTLTVNLNSGITWSDGTPFSASDVAYTFNLLVSQPQLNTTGIPVKSATAISPDQVAINFSFPGYTSLAQVGAVPIVPQHIWSKAADPATFTNPNPVGTGPYELSPGSFTSQGYLLVKNPHYWQKDMQPKVTGFRFVTYDSNTSANLALEQGDLDWSSNFVPEIQKAYVGKSADHHYWFPAVGPEFLCPNDALPKYQNTDVRKAISLALDRQAIVTAGEQGEQPAATSPSGLVLPRDSAVLDPALAGTTLQQNIPEAKSLLAAAGYKAGADGMLTGPDGKPLTATLNVPASFTDTLADFQVVAEQLKAVGIDATVQSSSEQAWISNLLTGNTDLTVCGGSLTGAVATPYQIFNALNGALTKPIGQLAFGDTERWNDTATTDLLGEYATSSSAAVQQTALNGLQQIMAQQVPVIPMAYTVAWDEYSTAVATGWPSAADPYATGMPTGATAVEVALHLTPVK